MKQLYEARYNPETEDWDISPIETEDPVSTMRTIRQTAIANFRTMISIRLNPSTTIYIKSVDNKVIIRCHDWLFISEAGSKRIYFYTSSKPKDALGGILWLINAFKNSTIKSIAKLMEAM